MARTFGKQPISLKMPSNSYLSYAVERHREGASETFTADSPVVATSGLIVEAATPVTAIFGFAVRAGQNLASGAYSEIVPVHDGLQFYANFLSSTDPSLNNGATGTANALAAADKGLSGYQIQKANILAGSLPAWFVADKADGTDAAMIVSFAHDMAHSSGNPIEEAEVGDLDARITAIVLDAVRSFD